MQLLILQMVEEITTESHHMEKEMITLITLLFHSDTLLVLWLLLIVNMDMPYKGLHQVLVRIQQTGIQHPQHVNKVKIFFYYKVIN